MYFLIKISHEVAKNNETAEFPRTGIHFLLELIMFTNLKSLLTPPPTMTISEQGNTHWEIKLLEYTFPQQVC